MRIINTRVSGDGTWMKRGHTLQFGIVSGISCETGEVLDFEIMSKHCSICKFHKSRLSPEEFEKWLKLRYTSLLGNGKVLRRYI